MNRQSAAFLGYPLCLLVVGGVLALPASFDRSATLFGRVEPDLAGTWELDDATSGMLEGVSNVPRRLVIEAWQPPSEEALPPCDVRYMLANDFGTMSAEGRTVRFNVQPPMQLLCLPQSEPSPFDGFGPLTGFRGMLSLMPDFPSLDTLSVTLVAPDAGRPWGRALGTLTYSRE